MKISFLPFRKTSFSSLRLGMALSVLVALMLGSGCKSAFEATRQSGDPERILKAAHSYYEEEKYQKAQTLYELIVGPYRGKPEAEDIYFNYAYTYYYMGQYMTASYYFKTFSDTYSISPKREEADFMTAYSSYRMSPSFRLDQTSTLEAIEGFQLFVNTFPNSDRVELCNRLIDELRQKLEKKAFEQARMYYNTRNYQSAMHSLENLMRDFPDTDNAPEINFYIIKSAYLLADNSILIRKEERYQDVLEKSTEFLARYPESEFAKEVRNIRIDSLKELKIKDDDRYQEQSARIGS
jgi:outer membrane protein assembly factor BamD